MTIKAIICDLDNTLLDTLSKMEELIPGYTIEDQKVYKIGEDLLKPFFDGSIYEGVKFNESVVNTLITYVNKGFTPVFISQTFTEVAREAKEKLIRDLYKLLSGRVNRELQEFTLYTHEPEIWSFIKAARDFEEVVFIDDAPERLECFYKDFPNSKVYRVTYAYNQELNHSGEQQSLYCNKFKGEYVYG